MPSPEVLHLKPATELAERVLLPGDPHRAFAMAQSMLESPRMFNHQRGLWGYTGTAPDGRPVTVQSTGVGGPSAAVVVEELVRLGARRLVRSGTCGALTEALALGDLVVANGVVPADGTSAALGAESRVEPDPEVTASLHEAAQPHGGAHGALVVTTDLFYDDRLDVAEGWLTLGASAVEMEAATILRIAERHGVAAGCVLAVTDVLAGGDAMHGRRRLDRAAIEEAGLRAGEVGLEAVLDADASGRSAPAGPEETGASAAGKL